VKASLCTKIAKNSVRVKGNVLFSQNTQHWRPGNKILKIVLDKEITRSALRYQLYLNSNGKFLACVRGRRVVRLEFRSGHQLS